MSRNYSLHHNISRHDGYNLTIRLGQHGGHYTVINNTQLIREAVEKAKEQDLKLFISLQLESDVKTCLTDWRTLLDELKKTQVITDPSVFFVYSAPHAWYRTFVEYANVILGN